MDFIWLPWPASFASRCLAYGWAWMPEFYNSSFSIYLLAGLAIPHGWTHYQGVCGSPFHCSLSEDQEVSITVYQYGHLGCLLEGHSSMMHSVFPENSVTDFLFLKHQKTLYSNLNSYCSLFSLQHFWLYAFMHFCWHNKTGWFIKTFFYVFWRLGSYMLCFVKSSCCTINKVEGIMWQKKEWGQTPFPNFY